MHSFFKSLILFFSLSIFTGCNSAIQNMSYDKAKGKFFCTYKNRTREFILCLPEKTDNAPLVLMLHGYGDSAEHLQTVTHFDEDACKKGYAVAFVEGTTDPNVKTSSKGWLSGNDKSAKNDIDFLEDLSLFLQKKYNLNKSGIYAAGFSNGAFMCTKLAVQKSKTFSAIVSVGGMMPKNVYEGWTKKSSKAARFFQINGTKDDVVPMILTGTAEKNPNPAMENVILSLAKSHRLSENDAEQIELSPSSTLTKYQNKVWWLLITDGRHNWPDKKISGINANDLILEFLENK